MTNLELAQLENTCELVGVALDIPRGPHESLEAWRDRLVANSDVRLCNGALCSVVAIKPGVVVTKVIVAAAMNYVCVDWDAIISSST